MITRTKAGVFKTKHHSYISSLLPSSLVHALLAAMDEELDALSSNDTWVSIPHPFHTNIVRSKWVFRIKYLVDGIVDHLKACLVAKGYSQLPGLDFHDTFNPVVKASTMCLVISFQVSYHGLYIN